MIRLFVPNGMTTTKVICKLAREEFGDKIKISNNYLSIKRDIMKAFRKMKPDELEENHLSTMVGIEHLNQNDFGNFMSIRFTYWGLMVAIAVMIAGDVPIHEYFNLSKSVFVNIIIIILTIILVVLSRTTRIQHDMLEYLNFKLICFEELNRNIKRR
jgi:hypothetical protein